ncbi:methylaspartate mutase epsilon subunit [Nocardiopsis mwathae]|uniref:Methylaspartate mutase epsilon subunit n=1 Tax=Nocardiopsis mwathae TaxID=1472723 RepID=A0A7W9YFG5_9ACTN|nr:methylaspartate mutase [Nocardiopsis mwathae]MBB6170291.1 methylaspartate mutase epsilon subunit [Nocardiopsis mwathae]
MSLVPGGARPVAHGDLPVDFGAFVRREGGGGGLVAQPRMGFSDPAKMREGLIATKGADASTVGTITLDSYTRVGDLAAAATALRDGIGLNGYPIVNHNAATTRRMLAGVRDADFPVQVRHGSAVPRDIFRACLELLLNASEGGPVSYCLPYGRTPLAESVRNWAECTALFSELRGIGVEAHLETFGGCMMGQLCPPSQLVAMSVLEALFFHQHGVRSISVSYAQQTSMAQDIEAVRALRRLCSQLLPTDNWHVVIYAYMGVYPMTPGGAYRLMGEAARLAVLTGSERIIVKTVAESQRIPVIAENVAALEFAGQVAENNHPLPDEGEVDTQTYREAHALVDAVLNLDSDIGRALLLAFKQGYLDIPYCVHPDNMGRARSYIDGDGWLRWAETGSLPLKRVVGGGRSRRLTAADLLEDLSYVQRKFDDEALELDGADGGGVGIGAPGDPAVKEMEN